MQIARYVVDPIIRHRAALHALPLDRYTIRIARTTADYEAAFRFLRAAYIYQGMEPVRSGPMRITPQHVLPEAVVLVAYEGDELVGTMTVTADSPAGLPIECLCHDEVECHRAKGHRLVEYGSLAVVERCWSTGVTLLLYMAAYHIAFGFLGATHCIIEVAPKAIPIYRAVFNFQVLGKPVPHPHLDLDVVTMIQDMRAVETFGRQYFRKPMSTGRLPVEHFVGEPPPCVQLPPMMSVEELTQWRMPREVFQELFVEKSDHLATLDATTAAYLGRTRSRDTLNLSNPTARTSSVLTPFSATTRQRRLNRQRAHA